jgi:hypothetical protein
VVSSDGTIVVTGVDTLLMSAMFSAGILMRLDRTDMRMFGRGSETVVGFRGHAYHRRGRRDCFFHAVE